MAIAKIIAEDPHVTGEIIYEPDGIPPDGRKVDFVIFGDDKNTYLEVKKAHPPGRSVRTYGAAPHRN